MIETDFFRESFYFCNLWVMKWWQLIACNKVLSLKNVEITNVKALSLFINFIMHNAYILVLLAEVFMIFIIMIVIGILDCNKYLIFTFHLTNGQIIMQYTMRKSYRGLSCKFAILQVFHNFCKRGPHISRHS